MSSRAVVFRSPASSITIAVVVALATLASLLVTAGPVDAAPKGQDIRPTARALVALVSPSQSGAFEVVFHNTGTSTITDLALRASVSGGSLSGTPLPPTCSPAGAEVICPMGNLASGAGPFTFRFFPVAGSPGGGVGALTLTAVFAGDSAQNNPQASKDDTWTVAASATVDSSAEVYGEWQQQHNAPETFGPVIGQSQRTTVHAGPVGNGYGVLVQQLNANVACAGGDVTGTVRGFGRAVDLVVNDGATPVDVTIVYQAAALGNTPVNQIELVHQNDDGTCDIVLSCDEAPTDPAGCFDLSVSGKGKNQVVTIVAHLPSNGRVKGV